MTPRFSAKDVFHSVLERYDDNPKAHSEYLRRLATSEPGTFLHLAREALLERNFTRGLEVVGNLMASAKFLGSLLDYYAESRDGAIALGTKLLVCEPQLDSILLSHAEKSRTAGLPVGKTVLPAIDIVDAISVDGRLVTRVLKFLKDPHPSVRSKAAIFVFRRTKNLTWIVNRSPNSEPRLKANALEALYEFRSEEAAGLFKASVSDQNNRVAANALLGLYLFGDTSSIPLIYDMASRAEPEFRVSSAWVMGKTEDPRFLETLTALGNDPSDMVRNRAIESLRQVKQTADVAARHDGFQLSVVKTQQQGDTSHISAIVRRSDRGAVQDIPGTRFILRVDGRAVTEYTVEQRVCPGSLDIAFVRLRSSAHDDLIAEDLVTGAIGRCLPLRRKDDRWAIIRASSAEIRSVSFKRTYIDVWGDEGPPLPAAIHKDLTVEFSASPSRIGCSIDQEPIAVNLTPERLLVHAVEGAIAASRQSAQRHLIFLAGDGAAGLVDTELRQALLTHDVRVHIIDSGRGALPAEIAQAANLSGGSYLSVAPELFADACYALYCSILHQYCIAWNGEPGKVDLEVFFQENHGHGSTVREKQLQASVR